MGMSPSVERGCRDRSRTVGERPQGRPATTGPNQRWAMLLLSHVVSARCEAISTRPKATTNMGSILTVWTKQLERTFFREIGKRMSHMDLRERLIYRSNLCRWR